MRRRNGSRREGQTVDGRARIVPRALRQRGRSDVARRIRSGPLRPDRVSRRDPYTTRRPLDPRDSPKAKPVFVDSKKHC